MGTSGPRTLQRGGAARGLARGDVVERSRPPGAGRACRQRAVLTHRHPGRPLPRAVPALDVPRGTTRFRERTRHLARGSRPTCFGSRRVIASALKEHGGARTTEGATWDLHASPCRHVVGRALMPEHGDKVELEGGGSGIHRVRVAGHWLKLARAPRRQPVFVRGDAVASDREVDLEGPCASARCRRLRAGRASIAEAGPGSASEDRVRPRRTRLPRTAK